MPVSTPTLNSGPRMRLILFILILLLLITRVEAIPSLQDAEILSKAATLLSTFWLRSRAHAEDEPGEYPLPPLDKPTLLGTPTLPTSILHIMHVNIGGGIAHFDKWRTVVELCSLKKPDVLVITFFTRGNLFRKDLPIPTKRGIGPLTHSQGSLSPPPSPSHVCAKRST
jgi:hypothetical protein